MKLILSFLSELQENNNRTWFLENREKYEKAKQTFERIGSIFIDKLKYFDSDIENLTIKQCIFRINRDIRFTHDKTPYKKHFAMFIGAPNGKKSIRSGYYFHIEPNNKSFLAVGVWSPSPEILTTLRKSIYYNIEEFDKIRFESNFEKLFGNSFYDDDKLKKMPRGFSADFSDPEILKLKHYMVHHSLTDDEVLSNTLIDRLAYLSKVAYPLNQFLNYAIDEEKL